MTVPTVYSRDVGLNMPDTAAGSLYGMAQEILTRAEQCLNQLGLAVPERRLVYPSPVAVDCEQLVVLFSGWSAQPPANGLFSCSDFRWCGMFSIGISRCTPALPGTRSAPTVDAMEAAARISSNDADALLLLAAGFDEMAEITVETAAPQGGFQTTALSVMLPAFGGLG